jgi:phytoene dehydrogenase-like protein
VTGLEPGGILRQVFDKLAVEVSHENLDPSIVFHIAGKSLGFSASVTSWKDALADNFPQTAQRYDAFWDWSHEAGGSVYRLGAALPSLPLQRPADVRRTLPAVSGNAIRLLPLLLRTVRSQQTRLGALGEPAIDAMIDALLMDATGATSANCSAVQGAIALDLYRRGCQRVEGGTGRLAMLLVRAIRREGGLVQFGEGVRSLAPTRSGWIAVTDGGEEAWARTVIANVPPAGLDLLLGRRPRLPNAADAWGAFTLHLGIDATGLAELAPYHQVIGPDVREGASFVSIFPSRRTGGARWSISVSRHVRAGPWRAGTDGQKRRCLEQQMLDDVATLIPDVRERVHVLRSATPATFERFTSRPGGFVGGVVQRRGVVALLAAGHRPERGLILAGDHYFPGQGTVGTALSGINAYRDATEHLGKKAII